MGQALPNTREPIHGAALTIGERQIIERKIERGTSNIRAEADLNKIRVAYTQQGPFTICMVSTPGSLPAMPGLYTPGTLQVAVGASKCHPNDLYDPHLGRRMAFLRAVSA